jgi:two-component sensor histidine kinase
MQTAVPLGLLVNEIVSNSFKHAHPRGRSGSLSVSLRTTDGIRLRIADDGVGLPEAPGSGDSLGLKLIDGLASQLDAQVKVFREGGTTYEINLPEEPHE